MSHNVKLIYNNDDDMEGYLGKCGGKNDDIWCEF